MNSPLKDDNAPTAHLPNVPDYELLRRIGSGSYGDVWLARNVLGQCRAVKIIYRNRFMDPRPFEREFEGIQRFEPISRSHPSQLHILHVGKNDAAGCFYYVMELADDANAPVAADVRRLTSTGARVSGPAATPDGQSASEDSEHLLPGEGAAAGDSRAPRSEPPHVGCYEPRTLHSDIERHTRLPIPDCVQIGLSLATALAHLHEQGLVHRDIKPSNIIFVNGVAKLGDIGLVTDLGDTQSIVGTEGYLPPEGPGTPQADLFSLGKVLYEISTGLDRRRFSSLPEDSWTWPDRDQLMEFNEIVLRACAKDPSERYQTAEQLRADLALLQAGKSVLRQRQASQYWQILRRSSAWLAFVVFAFALFALSSRLMSPATKPEFRKRSTNSIAQDLYDIGRTYYQKNAGPEVAKAAEYFQAAVKADPNFALAQAALAVTWCWADVDTNAPWALLPQAQEIAERAVAKDDTLSEAHLAVAFHAFMKQWDWPKAKKHYQKAIKCDPQNAQPHEWCGMFLRSMGQTNEAIRELEVAVDLNPQSQTGIRFLGWALFSARRYSEAIGRYEKAVQIDPSAGHLLLLSEALLWDGQIDRSLAVSARAAELDGKDPAKVAAQTAELKRIFHEEGAAAFWRKRLEILRGKKPDSIDLAEACAMAGRTDEALDLLERAYQEHHIKLVWDLKTHPEWDNLRGHPRFKALLKKLRLD